MTLSAHHHNPKLLKTLALLQRTLLLIPVFIAVPILLAWLAPTVATLLPSGWALMKANTALCTILCACGLWLGHFCTNTSLKLTGKLLGAIVLVFAGCALVGHITDRTFALDTLLAKDELSSVPGRMSMQTSLFFTMLGFASICESSRGPFCTQVRDVVCALLVALVLTVFAGYLFNATHLFGQANDLRTSIQTLFCMLCITSALLIARMHYGYFSIIAGVGIGSHIARLILPVTLLLPFLIVSVSAWLPQARHIPLALASALTSSFAAAALFVLVVWLSRKINDMEAELRDISLIDDLTGINNRRGFYMLGEHMLYEAQRDNRNVSVLFFDLDGLKEINDTLGHDIGSDLLKHFASLLRQHFRKSDAVARLGGDEFAVVSSSGDNMIALKRLERVVQATNKAGKRPYTIRYSVGEATFNANNSLGDFNELVSAADVQMYERKRAKKALNKSYSRANQAPVSQATP